MGDKFNIQKSLIILLSVEQARKKKKRSFLTGVLQANIMEMDESFIDNVGKEANQIGKEIIGNKGMEVRMATVSD